MLASLHSAALGFAGAPLPSAGPHGSKPHIFLFLADDYGHANLYPNIKDLGEKECHDMLGERDRNVDPQCKQLKAEAATATPFMTSLIEDEGVLLTRHYSYAICSPSRAALHSGRFGSHVNMYNTGVNVYNGNDPDAGFAGIPIPMTGMAQVLKDAGYKTHATGKWDAGMATPANIPTGKGYDTFAGYYQHANDFWSKKMSFTSTGEIDNCLSMFRDFSERNSSFSAGIAEYKYTNAVCDDAAVAPEQLLKSLGRDVTDATVTRESRPDAGSKAEKFPACYEETRFFDEALRVLHEYKPDPEHPLFLAYMSHLVHSPMQVGKYHVDLVDDEVKNIYGGHRIDTFNRRIYVAMTRFMDDVMKELVGVFKAKGMWENTLMGFLTDNGGAIYEPAAANNFPLKGGKYSDWEGGVRANAFMAGGYLTKKGMVGGTRYDGVFSIADWYATFGAVAHGCEVSEADALNKPLQTTCEPVYDKSAAAANANRNETYLDLDVYKTSDGKDRKPTPKPPIPPVDGRPMLSSILSGGKGRYNTPLHVSPKTVMIYPWKLVTQDHPYSTHLGPLYPNCTTVKQTQTFNGPYFVDMKIFEFQATFYQVTEIDAEGNEVKLPKDTPSVVNQTRVTWEEDAREGWLFNLEDDPFETKPLNIMFPGNPVYQNWVKRLQRQLYDENKKLFLPNRGDMVEDCCQVYAKEGGFYGPFRNRDGSMAPVKNDDGSLFYKGVEYFDKEGPLSEAKAGSTEMLLAFLNRPAVVECIRGLAYAMAPASFQKMVGALPTGSLDQCVADDEEFLDPYYPPSLLATELPSIPGIKEQLTAKLMQLAKGGGSGGASLSDLLGFLQQLRTACKTGAALTEHIDELVSLGHGRRA